MSVTYQLVLENGNSLSKEGVACFGALQDTEELLNWELDGDEAAPIKSIVYYMVDVDRKFFDYLMRQPLVKAAVVELKLEDTDYLGTTYGGTVEVSASVNGHHMLNVLSMFRTPHAFNLNLKTWHTLVDAGIAEDIAHVLSFHYLTTDDGSIIKYITKHDEHSYFSSQSNKEALAVELEFLANSHPDGPNDELSGSFSDVGFYVRSDNYDYWEGEGEDCGVSSQCVNYMSVGAANIDSDLPELKKEKRYVDIDVAKEEEVNKRYEGVEMTPELEEEKRNALLECVVSRGVEKVDLSKDEAIKILSSLAQELA